MFSPIILAPRTRTVDSDTRLPASSAGVLWEEGRGSSEGREGRHSPSRREAAASLKSALSFTSDSHRLRIN